MDSPPRRRRPRRSQPQEGPRRSTKVLDVAADSGGGTRRAPRFRRHGETRRGSPPCATRLVDASLSGRGAQSGRRVEPRGAQVLWRALRSLREGGGACEHRTRGRDATVGAATPWRAAAVGPAQARCLYHCLEVRPPCRLTSPRRGNCRRANYHGSRSIAPSARPHCRPISLSNGPLTAAGFVPHWRAWRWGAAQTTWTFTCRPCAASSGRRYGPRRRGPCRLLAWGPPRLRQRRGQAPVVLAWSDSTLVLWLAPCPGDSGA